MKDQLIKQSTGMVYWLYRRFRATVFVREEWAEDIISNGLVGLVKAAHRYEPGRGSFMAFAKKYIWGHMLNGLCQCNEIPPEVLKRYLRIKAHRERLRRLREREPTVRDLAKAVGCKESTLRSTLRWVEGRTYLSPEERAQGTGDGTIRLRDVLPDSIDLEAALERTDEVRRALAMCSPERRRLLVEHYLHGRSLNDLSAAAGKPVRQIERELEATLEEVRQRLGVKAKPEVLPRSFPRERFWSNVRKTDGCWEWTGTLTRQGYGQFSEKRGDRWVHHLAHRLSWMLSKGAVPDGHSVIQCCGNRGCVRPEHLEVALRSRRRKPRAPAVVH